MVLPIIIFSFVVVSLLWALIVKWFGIDSGQFENRIVGASSLFLAGTINHFATRRYVIDKDGENEFYEEEGTFMFVPVTLWTRIFFVIGVLSILATIADRYKL